VLRGGDSERISPFLFRSFSHLLYEPRRLDVIQLWEFSRQVLVSLNEYARLVGAGMIAVTAPQAIDEGHSLNDFTDRSEVVVEVGIIPQVE
jgi:hypothetical protein